ncbi:hypothetical protein THII_2011 [Thioploca ingrica]|uniref:Uncharacterized protein n=1 Tax=Thioploca ingrica TaxID=40754 RepID=A0A090AED2_9GAMM|nr:hypothetical protein THII_2011 [Thioploca ingrica]
MMRLLNLTANPHPEGNRIELQWVNPAPERYADVQILRSDNTYPTLVDGQLPAAGFIGTVTTAALFTLGLQFTTPLNRRLFSTQLREIFSQNNIVFSPAVTIQIETAGEKWRIVEVNQLYLLVKQGDHLNVYVQPSTFSDRQSLQGETVYYYTLIPSNPGDYQFDPHNQVAAMATAPYQLGGQMYELLPALYHRYDTVLPPAELAHPTEPQWGQLRRFLAIPGSQLDWIYSLATSLLNLVQLDKVDGRLLPLLAEWIGWQTNYRQQRGVDNQRNEIRQAPYLYQTIGTLPTVTTTLNRLLGWENRFWDNRLKELFNNVVLSNRPEQLNFWALTRLANTWSSLNKPLSLDFAYEGRAVVAHQKDSQEWGLFYHTQENERWAIWYKTLSTLTLALEPFITDLNRGLISIQLQNQLAERGWLLSDTAQVEVQSLENAWWLNDPAAEEIYFIQKENNQLIVYHWAPSQPLNHSRRIDKHPTAGYCQERLWVWWESYDPLTQRWRIDYLTINSPPGSGGVRGGNGDWSERQPFTANPPDPNEPQRRQPWLALTPDLKSFWLFWLEQTAEKSPWQLKYQFVEPTAVEPKLRVPTLERGNQKKLEPTVKPESAVETFPEPGPLADLFALTLPDDSLWVFWARREPNWRWQIVYRVKPKGGQWDELKLLVTPTPDYDARELTAQVIDNGAKIELFWSSNRSGSWSIWCGILAVATGQLSDVQMLTSNPYSQHHPSPITLESGVTWLIYRANDRVFSRSPGGIETVDFRAAGSTTLDLANSTKLSLQGQWGDFQTYTYDIGQPGQRTASNWYARDTVAIYLTSALQNPLWYQQDQLWLTSTLQQFLPIQTRVVFALEPILNQEFVYTYDFPKQTPQRRLEEFWDNQLYPASQDSYTGLTDNFTDAAPDWIWIQALPGESLPQSNWRTTVDFNFNPNELSERIHAARFRTCYLGLTAGGFQCGNN